MGSVFFLESSTHFCYFSVKKVLPNAAPKASASLKKPEPEAYSTKQLPVEDIDTDRDNPQLVSYYAKDIYSYLRELEVIQAFSLGICRLLKYCFIEILHY